MKQIVKKQEETIQMLSNQLIKSKEDKQYTINKLEVALLKIKESNLKIENLQNDLLSSNELFENLTESHHRAIAELDNSHYKIAQISKDYVDALVKMNLTNKSRVQTETINKNLYEELESTKAEINRIKEYRRKDMTDNQRMCNILKEQQMEIAQKTSRVEYFEKHLVDVINDNVNKNNNLLKLLKVEQDMNKDIRHALLDEQDVSKKILSEKANVNSKIRSIELKANKYKIELDSVKRQYDYLNIE